MTLQAIHDFELALLEPCLSMTRRGVLIDEPLRQDRIAALKATITPLELAVKEAVIPLLYAGMPRESLFRDKWTCPCCRNGKDKRDHCWACAGFDKKPSKKALNTYYEKVAAALDKTGMLWELYPDGVPPELPPCGVCGGEGQRTAWVFNLASNEQKAVVLFHLLKLPKRIQVDENALKSLLPLDKSGVIKRMLEVTKAETMIKIYERLAPAEDGRIHTFYNPAGTETARFSSSGGEPLPKPNKPFALIKSTNLSNMPKREVKGNDLYNVRECLVASPGHQLVEGDLSGAEAWITAALRKDFKALDRLQDPTFDVHKWTGSSIFRKPADEITKAERMTAKTCRHAFERGVQWKTLMADINSDALVTGITIDAQEAKRIITVLHKLEPKIEEWWRELQNVKQLKTFVLGRVRTFFGRRQGDGWLDHVHKQLMSFQPQADVADTLNMGLLSWWNNYEGKFGWLLMQVYDSIILESLNKQVKVAAAMVAKCLEIPITVNGITLTIPADVSVGRDWANMELL